MLKYLLVKTCKTCLIKAKMQVVVDLEVNLTLISNKLIVIKKAIVTHNTLTIIIRLNIWVVNQDNLTLNLRYPLWLLTACFYRCTIVWHNQMTRIIRVLWHLLLQLRQVILVIWRFQEDIWTGNTIWCLLSSKTDMIRAKDSICKWMKSLLVTITPQVSHKAL